MKSSVKKVISPIKKIVVKKDNSVKKKEPTFVKSNKKFVIKKNSEKEILLNKTKEKTKIEIRKHTDKYGTVNLISLSTEFDTLFVEKVVSPIERVVGKTVKREVNTDFLESEIGTESIKYFFQIDPIEGHLSFEKFFLHEYVCQFINDDFYYSIFYTYCSNKFESNSLGLFLSIGYSKNGKKKLGETEEVKNLIQEIKNVKRRKQEKEEKEKLESERKRKEIDELKTQRKNSRLRSFKSSTIETEPLFHIEISESYHGEHYCSDYIINQRLMNLINENIGSGFETLGDGVDITGRYGFINYTIKKKDIKVLSQNTVEIKKQYKKELSKLNYTSTDYLEGEKIIIIPLSRGRDYFEDTIGYSIEERLED